ncbi:MAG: hypothetical protein COV36_01295 [Alphaproteobacteria bacterium CG11_big_fil_rev_8_21_14_0_20_44_7]|nr:MAG: hypothetical protein COV36_01295 [Alphaproteobacteria bacterium CG11_big_fil_rev_8_21_14_0_20_44_7]
MKDKLFEIMGMLLLLPLFFTVTNCSQTGGFNYAYDHPTVQPGENPPKVEEASEFEWPLENADLYLEEAKPGEVINTLSYEGEPAEFVVAMEYRSASKKFCKNYYVNKEEFLACFNPHWTPVRLFK